MWLKHWYLFVEISMAENVENAGFQLFLHSPECFNNDNNNNNNNFI